MTGRRLDQFKAKPEDQWHDTGVWDKYCTICSVTLISATVDSLNFYFPLILGWVTITIWTRWTDFGSQQGYILSVCYNMHATAKGHPACPVSTRRSDTKGKSLGTEVLYSTAFSMKTNFNSTLHIHLQYMVLRYMEIFTYALLNFSKTITTGPRAHPATSSMSTAVLHWG